MRLATPPMIVFQEKTIPHGAQLAGWALFAQHFAIPAPVRRPSCVSEQHVRGSHRHEEEWSLFDKRYWPGDTFAGHLGFALRHEPIDLLILKRAFDAAPAQEVEGLVRAAPTSILARRAWYFYEALTGRTLDVEDAPNAAAIDLLDAEEYFTGRRRLSKRHRVRDNLLGTGRFCPVIRRTESLKELVALDLSQKARETVGRTGAHLVARATSFLLLSDSRASFEIEGERPPRNRVERWGRAILQAGKHPLTMEEILRLQRVLIEDALRLSRAPSARRFPRGAGPQRRPIAGIHRRQASRPRRSYGGTAGSERSHA